MKLDVKNTAGSNVGQIDLSDDVFATEVHEHLLWEVVKWQLAKRRGGNASTKRMSEVVGSSKKVWKQKGTGQARQFTLYASTRKGNRPSFTAAAEPGEGERLFRYLSTQAGAQLGSVATGRFGADMQVSLVNDGPVTFWLQVVPAGLQTPPTT